MRIETMGMPKKAYFLLCFGTSMVVLAFVSGLYALSDIPYWIRIGIVLLGVIMVFAGIFLNVRHNKAEHLRVKSQITTFYD